ncbi:uncharacterized protein with ParB-like and HNH nuclease domain [Staphylococcus pasteuri]|uniref:Uncharacterized conserved protein, contains ParB-like and HNH nuclease domains n=2 Tax=Staphylococcus TaxID=1279 RepID=A0ABY1H6Z6_9STAP|nr:MULTISPECIES: DUF262 domain-containing protein [Staphylococcus]KKI55831.1 hypothetical protein UF70_2270 [Staphylococcus pasteuri]MDI3232003.1 DUF262 domain-containing protein [Staphylococcus pasteuri]MDO6573723.1 DUF262 domain-containing protein [Staphylococcus pasteuri_A]SFZ77929.1 Uncharacterized conserved protein, contains ParB-like and HNH nuclease domains [Staphylococcus pasteuri]
MDLKPDKKIVSEMFPIEIDVTYNIPIYQRNYSWRDENIEALVKDIEKEDSGYYLGNIIVTERKDKPNFYDIIDGQQRITTILLILLAIYDNLNISMEKLNQENEKDLFRDAANNQGRIKDKILKLDGSSPLLLLSPDKEIYIDLLNRIINNDENAKPHKNKVLGKRYEFTKNLLRNNFFGEKEMLDTNCIEDGTKSLIHFYNKLNNAEILRITVPNLNDGFTVFTSFNAKGVPLTLIDLFKSFYLKETDGNISQQEATSKWEELISIFYNENDEPISSVVTQFLLNNYDAFESKKQSSITQSSALKLYEKIFKDKGYKYIDELILRAKIFSNISGKIETLDILNLDQDIQKKFFDLEKLESTQTYPITFFLLNKYYEGKVTKDLISDFLDFLLTYYVRRNIILKPKASNIRARAIQSVKKLNEVDIIEIGNVENIKNIFKSIAATDEDFRNALNGPIYLTSKNTTRIILVNLERKHGNFFSKQTPENLDSITDKGNYIWTLEHIMPQSAYKNENWKGILTEKVENEEQLKVLIENNIHKVGNLTLTGYNSEMSAKTFVEKRDYRDGKTNKETGLKTKLFLNESISGEKKDINDKEIWDIKDIERRTKELINYILPMYSFE